MGTMTQRMSEILNEIQIVWLYGYRYEDLSGLDDTGLRKAGLITEYRVRSRQAVTDELQRLGMKP